MSASRHRPSSARAALFCFAAALFCPVAIVAGVELVNHAFAHPRPHWSLTYDEMPPPACRRLAAALGKTFDKVTVNAVHLDRASLSPVAIASACALSSNRLVASAAIPSQKN